MAKGAQNNPTDTAFNCTLTIPNKFFPVIDRGVESGDTIGQKVSTIAEGAVLDLCEGGLMLHALSVKKLTEAFGKVPGVDDVVEQFSKGVGRVGGKLQITVSLPPEMEDVIKAAAEFQGVSVEQVLNDLWNTAWDNGDFYDWRPYVARLLMRVDDKAALVKVLGKDFETGTELAEIVKKHCVEHASPFEEVGK